MALPVFGAAVAGLAQHDRGSQQVLLLAQRGGESLLIGLAAVVAGPDDFLDLHHGVDGLLGEAGDRGSARLSQTTRNFSRPTTSPRHLDRVSPASNVSCLPLTRQPVRASHLAFLGDRAIVATVIHSNE